MLCVRNRFEVVLCCVGVSNMARALPTGVAGSFPVLLKSLSISSIRSIRILVGWCDGVVDPFTGDPGRESPLNAFVGDPGLESGPPADSFISSISTFSLFTARCAEFS